MVENAKFSGVKNKDTKISLFLGGTSPADFSTAGDASPRPPPPLSTPMLDADLNNSRFFLSVKSCWASGPQHISDDVRPPPYLIFSAVRAVVSNRDGNLRGSTTVWHVIRDGGFNQLVKCAHSLVDVDASHSVSTPLFLCYTGD